MASGPVQHGGNGRLATAGKDVKNIADGIHPKFPKRVYNGDEKDFTTHKKRNWKGRMGKRGPWRRNKEETVSHLWSYLPRILLWKRHCTDFW